MFAIFFPTQSKAFIFPCDSVRTNEMPNLNNIFLSERAAKFVVPIVEPIVEPIRSYRSCERSLK